MLEAIASDVSDAGQPISLTVAPEAVLRCKPLALQRALINLIDNSLKYGGAARVRLDRTPEIQRITIDDDGPGIPASEREKVFGPFYRQEDSRNRETGGVGLGLTIARTVIRGLGGDIALGNAPQRGLRVEVALPRSRE